MFLRTLLGLVLASSALAQGVARRVLVVDLDDVGYDLVQATPTPTLDTLAARGRSFSSFLVAPSCSPTRALLQMGAYGSHPDVLIGQVVSMLGPYELPQGPLVPLAEAAARAGRTTAKVGKWHLAPVTRVQHPHELGWQHYSGSPGNLHGDGIGYERYVKVTNGVVGLGTTYITTDETNDAIALVMGGVDLVSVSYHAPHAPWHEPPAHLHTIAPITSDYDRARAMLQAADRELGRLLAVALPRGYTVIVYTDNGTAAPLGGGKGTVYDSGVRVPCFAIGPGVVSGVDATPCGAVDLYATVLELLGVTVAGPTFGPHSRSMVPLLAGHSDGRRWAYAERFGPNGSDPRTTSTVWSRAARGERYKLVRDQGLPGDRLFDLWVDPNEQFDLIAAGGLAPGAAGALVLFRDVLARM
jgi:arylsulfatase A-like enzyme